LDKECCDYPATLLPAATGVLLARVGDGESDEAPCAKGMMHGKDARFDPPASEPDGEPFSKARVALNGQTSARCGLRGRLQVAAAAGAEAEHAAEPGRGAGASPAVDGNASGGSATR
jgi:hypothetical protein